jgi:hypothetical protein
MEEAFWKEMMGLFLLFRSMESISW